MTEHKIETDQARRRVIPSMLQGAELDLRASSFFPNRSIETKIFDGVLNVDLASHKERVSEDMEIHFKANLLSVKLTQNPVIFIHGLCGDLNVWHFQAPSFSDRGVFVDLPGCGNSSRPQGHNYTVEGASASINAILDRIGDRQATLVGFSYGGLVALDCAARYSEKIKKVIVLDQPLVPPVPDRKIVSEVIAPMLQDGPKGEEFFQMLTSMLIGEKMCIEYPEVSGQISRQMSSAPKDVRISTFTNALSQAIDGSWMGQMIQCPLTLVRGEQSIFTVAPENFGIPESYEKLLFEWYPTLESILHISNSGHFLPIEGASFLNRIILAGEESSG